VDWNDSPLAVSPTSAGSLLATQHLAGPAPVALPNLNKAVWHYAPESPEANPAFDDSS
jgi:hypothetical protein